MPPAFSLDCFQESTNLKEVKTYEKLNLFWCTL